MITLIYIGTLLLTYLAAGLLLAFTDCTYKGDKKLPLKMVMFWPVLSFLEIAKGEP